MAFRTQLVESRWQGRRDGRSLDFRQQCAGESRHSYRSRMTHRGGWLNAGPWRTELAGMPVYADGFGEAHSCLGDFLLSFSSANSAAMWGRSSSTILPEVSTTE